MNAFRKKPGPSTVVTARISKALMEDLTRIAEANETYRSDIIVTFLSDGVDEYLSKNTLPKKRGAKAKATSEGSVFE